MYFSPPPTDGRLQIVQSKSLVDLASDGDLREIVINANIMLGMDKRKFSFPFQIETQNCISLLLFLQAYQWSMPCTNWGTICTFSSWNFAKKSPNEFLACSLACNISTMLEQQSTIFANWNSCFSMYCLKWVTFLSIHFASPCITPQFTCFLIMGVSWPQLSLTQLVITGKVENCWKLICHSPPSSFSSKHKS